MHGDRGKDGDGEKRRGRSRKERAREGDRGKDGDREKRRRSDGDRIRGKRGGRHVGRSGKGGTERRERG